MAVAMIAAMNTEVAVRTELRPSTLLADRDGALARDLGRLVARAKEGDLAALRAALKVFDELRRRSER